MFRLPLPGPVYLEINLRELLRRCRQESRRSAVVVMLLLLGIGASPFAVAALRGAGTVIVTGVESVAVNGRHRVAGSLRLPAGVHHLRAERAGWIASETLITVTRNLTVTWPATFSIRKPHVREIRPGTPGYGIDDVRWLAPGQIRFHASEAQRVATPPAGQQGATAMALGLPEQIWELETVSGRMARRMDLEGAGVARLRDQGAATFSEQTAIADGDHETLIRVLPGVDGAPATLLLERTGQADTLRVSLPESVWVEQVHWSSLHQQAIIIARTAPQPIVAAGSPAALRLLRYSPEHGLARITDLPGDLMQFDWSDQPQVAAFVVTVRLPGQSTLALVLVRPDGTAQYLQDLPGGLWTHDQAPIGWTPDALLYAAPSADGTGTAVWRAPLNGTEPAELLRDDARAFRLNAGMLQYLRVEQNVVELCSFDPQTGRETECFVLTDVPPTPGLVGWWRDGQIVVRGGEHVFLVTLNPTSPIMDAARSADATASPTYSRPDLSASQLDQPRNAGRATTGATALKHTAVAEPTLMVRPAAVVTPTPHLSVLSSEPRPLPTLQGE